VTLAVRASIAKKVTSTQTVGISLGQTIATGTTGDIQGLLGTWQRTGNVITIIAEGGVRPYTQVGQSGFKVAPGGSIGVAAHLPGHNTIGLRYERAVEQAVFLQGTHLSNRVAASYELVAGRRLTLDASGFYGVNMYPYIPGYRLTGTSGTAGMRYVLVQNLAVVLNYTRWIREESSSAPFSSYRTTMSLAYGRAWR
jgi:hypothetical protein